MSDYTVFASNCIEELKVLQDKLFEKYDLNSYENWYYNQATGLFTFYTGAKEINFKYYEVGTFSTTKQTWMWSWFNSTTDVRVSKECESVKNFGLKSGFSKLMNGHFECDEVDAWELAAIALKITGGLGVYRPNSDNLLIFVVLQEVVDNETAQTIKDKYIDCKSHGSNRTAFICQHILSKEKVGFEEAFETYENMELDEDDDFQAWCNECELVRQKEHGWNETSMAFADIKLVCEKCYFKFKEINLGYRS